jgi:hypothetical protein
VSAWLGGIGMVLRAPILLAGITVLTLAAAAPFGFMLGSQIQDALASMPVADAGSVEIDAAWWMEFRANAGGLAATFTPTVIGFAAPLDNLSALLDGSPRPLILMLPVAVSGLLWALLWGGLLHRFHSGNRAGMRAFWRAAFRMFPGNVAIAATAALVNLILFLTVHAVLFGPVYGAVAARLANERDAFLVRVFLYVVFGALLVTVSLIADYARVHMAGAAAGSSREAIVASARFVRRHAPAVVTVYLLTGTWFVVLLVTYGAIEQIGNTQVGGWRSILLGQAFIVGRLALRLVFGASAVSLFNRLEPRGEAALVSD